MKAARLARKAWESGSRIQKVLIALVILGGGLGAYALAGSNTVQSDYYMRSDAQSVNSYSAGILGTTQSSSSDLSYEQSGTGGQTAYWGARIFTVDENGTVSEITGGNPVAVVTRSSNGGGIQSANYTVPETNLHYNDALLIRVYISVGSNNYQLQDEFITDDLNASKLTGKDWRFNYYTEYDTQTNGPPFDQYTNATFRWGSTTYNSGIDAINYSVARLEANQTEPNAEVDTYPGASFSQKAEVICRASSCKDVKVVPQACSGRTCTGFNDSANVSGLSWSSDSKDLGKLSRGETALPNFTVTADSEGEYRIRFNATSPNVRFSNTSSEVVDVDVADVNLTDLEHENLVEAGVREYEVSDTLDFFNTTLNASGGTAFNLTVSPSIESPSGTVVSWGPDTTEDCGNVSAGSSCEREFGSFDIPVDEDAGTYNFSVDFAWKNSGSKTNDTVTFDIVDVRGTFSSSVGTDTILQGESTEYGFSMTNSWSSSISDVNVTVNCDETELNCTEKTSSFTSSLSDGETFSSTFNISSNSSTEPDNYDVNVTVNYTNPNEDKGWYQVENRIIKVSSSDSLITEIIELPDNIFQAEYAYNISSSSGDEELFMPLNGTETIDAGFDSFNHTVYGTVRASDGTKLDLFHQKKSQGGVNQSNVGDGDGNEYCVLQTNPVNYTSCPNPPSDFLKFYPLDETGTNAWEYFNSKHASIVGASQGVEGYIGDAYSFSGSGDYLEDPDGADSVDGLSAFTIVAWVKSDVTGTDRGFITHRNPDGSDDALNIRYDDSGTNTGRNDVIKAGFTSTQDGEVTIESSANVQSTEWQQIAFTWDSGGEMKLYINGSEDILAENTTAGGQVGNVDKLLIGQGPKDDLSTGGWDGKIDGVRFYRKELSAGQIQELYQSDRRLGLQTEEPSDFPDRITRGETLQLDGSMENIADQDAQDSTLNWTLASGWDNATGNLNESYGTLNPGDVVFNNVTADVTLSADRGPTDVILESNSSTVRGDQSLETVDVYADTTTDLVLNETDAIVGEEVKADITLSLDTGGPLENQEVELRDEDSDIIDTVTTDSNGEATTTFTVPEDWNIAVQEIDADYAGNSSIYTNPSKGEGSLDVHDLPVFENVSAEPKRTGYGFNVTITANITDEEGPGTTNLTVEKPDGTVKKYEMVNQNNSGTYGQEWQYNYTETFQNGAYMYNITASDSEGYENTTTGHEFQVRTNASLNVVTDKDEYGPNQDVSLQREGNWTRNATPEFATLTEKRYAEEKFSESFDTVTGTSTDHTDTHVLDGNYFTMTEADGSPPDTPDEFEGVYSYSTGLSNVDNITVRSLGNVSSGSWDVEVRNFTAGSWQNLYTISETSDTWDNVTACSSSECGGLVSNGDIDIRVTTSSARGGAEASYNVDYQKLRVEGSGSVSETENPSMPVAIGEGNFTRDRLYRKFDLDVLPIKESANIKGADLVLNVTGGSGTGEVHHTENFTSGDTASTIHADGAPGYANASNPVATFSSTAGVKRIDVTPAVNSTFVADERYVGLQLREQGEDQKIEAGGPVYLEINFSAESEIFNFGDVDTKGYVILRVQENTSSGWSNEGFPVVDQSDGIYRINSSSKLDLANLWSNGGGFNTQLRDSGTYRVLARFVDSSGNTLKSDDRTGINNTYQFEILGPQLNLTDIDHENLDRYSVNEYETSDNIEYVNVTINNSEAEAVNASATLQVIDGDNNTVAWGPNSLKIFGDIPSGGSEERQWNNSSSGYEIPESVGPGTLTFRWNTTLDADNTQKKSNYSVDFFIHDVPSNLSSTIKNSDNQILRNESTLYNFSVDNPWSGPIDQVNVTVNCDTTQLNCTEDGGSTSTVNLGTVSGGGTGTASFNISTNSTTEIGNYDVNGTIEYYNPGGERKVWEFRENRILEVRIPGSLLNISRYPDNVTRGGSGYDFDSFANNTFSDDLTNVTLDWEIPQDWNNDTGDLEVTQETQAPGELIYNNFTGSVASGEELGEYRINESTDNDQGRVDDEFVWIDVYANTTLTLTVNETDPAVNETIEVTGELLYDNGSAVVDERVKFYDLETSESLGSGLTDSSGTTSITYGPPRPLGNHTLEVNFSGSSADYLRASEDLKNITVHDRPNVTDLSADPYNTGFGFNRTINATVRDNDGVSSVDLRVTLPNGTTLTNSMVNVAGDTYQYNFSETWYYGSYTYEVVATDTFSKSSTNSSNFLVNLFQKSSIETERYDYFPDQYVNLTENRGTWWNKSFEYRRPVTVNETSGNQLNRYPTGLVVSNLGSKTNSCDDLRFIEDQEIRDVYVESCNPSGDTQLYVSANVSASASENDTFLYYGNSTVADLENELFAYSINDSGTVDPGETTLDRDFTYNGQNATFRQVNVTMFGSGFSGTVTGYYYENDSSATLFDGSPASGTTVVNELYLQEPLFDRIRVQMEDGGGGQSDDVSFDYNFTTPDYTDADDNSEQDRFPSLIDAVGSNDFMGRLVLQVLNNDTGSFEVVSTRFNDSNPRTISDEEYFFPLWNDNPWYTGTRDAGFYRARFQLRAPSGRVLSDSVGKIEQFFTFRLNPPRSEVGFQDIEVYNVTNAADQRANADNLEDSGLNSTLTVKGNETYRIDVEVNNSDSASEPWSIDSQDVVELRYLNSSWNVLDIYYENETQTFDGGSFDGNVSWNTSNGGKLQPGTEANFSVIVEVPNRDEFRDIQTVVNDSAFLREDDSDLEVIKKESQPPKPLSFNVSDNLTRGEQLNASAYWDEVIDTSEAEYNSTSKFLNNFTVSPSGQWTNYSTETDSEWVRGAHQFRFYASDANDNTNSTRKKFFDVYGIASLNSSSVNETRVSPGEYVNVVCRVVSDRDQGISDYNVTFYNETSVFGYSSTNSTGYASEAYTSNATGYQDLTCGIERNESEYWEVDVFNLTETVRFAENQEPLYYSPGSNVTRVFKSTANDTVKWFANWTDNSGLETAAVVRGDGFYSFTENYLLHEVGESSPAGLFGALNGTSPINEGVDMNQHFLYGTLVGENNESIDVLHDDFENGGWNDTVVANATDELCVFQTLPENYTSCPRPPQGLETYYALDESGGAAWDHLGGHDADINSTTQGAPGYVGRSYEFDGSGDYLEDADAENYINGLSSFTVSAWVRSDVTGVDRGVITGQTPDGSDDGFDLRYDSSGSTTGNSDTIKAGFSTTDNGQVNVEANANVQSTEWQHLVFTWESGGELKIYVNGTDETAESVSATGEVTNVDTLLIGQGPKDDLSTGGWDGEIDNLRIYSRSLSSSEVDVLFQKNKRIGPEQNVRGELPSSDFSREPLSGLTAWSNFTVDIPLSYPKGDFDWSIYANDTSSNANSTVPIPVDVWAWAFVDSGDSGAVKNPVELDETFEFQCEYRQGNGTGIPSYNVTYWDNNTGDGSFQRLGSNDTGSSGLSKFFYSYSSTGAYEFKCNVTENAEKNVKPFGSFRNYSEVIEVKTGDVEPPVIINGNYGLNASELYKGFGSFLSFAEWNETIDYAYLELNATNSTLEQRKIAEPYTSNFTNSTQTVYENWTVGTQYVKTYANDTEGNLNDTLEFLKIDIWGFSQVNWLDPTGQVEQGSIANLTCGVTDNHTSSAIENYQVSFYDNDTQLIGTNTTKANGEAVYKYNTSDLSTGNYTWSCRIQDEPDLYYNTSSQDLDSEDIEIVSDLAEGELEPSLTDPADGSTLAVNKTYPAEASITCRNADCGQVDATIRYNASGSEADTAVPENSGEPFHTDGANTKTCDSDLLQDETCVVTWDINATGPQDSFHDLDVEATGDTAQTNDSVDNTVRIDFVLALNVTYDLLDFPQGAPDLNDPSSVSDPNVVAAPNNSEGYKVELLNNSNDATGGAWIKGTQLNRTVGGSDADYRNIPPENTSYTIKPSCDYSSSIALHRYYSQIVSFLGAGDSFEQCYFQEIPQATLFGIYEGNITIKVNATN